MDARTCECKAGLVLRAPDKEYRLPALSRIVDPYLFCSLDLCLGLVNSPYVLGITDILSDCVES